jgi:hypothetical protein
MLTGLETSPRASACSVGASGAGTGIADISAQE